jgi:hypothetical protein
MMKKYTLTCMSICRVCGCALPQLNVIEGNKAFKVTEVTLMLMLHFTIVLF